MVKSEIDKLTVLEQERIEALVENDAKRFSELAHSELSYLHSSGVLDTKESYINNWQNGTYNYLAITSPIQKVFMSENTAVIYGQMTAKLTVNGESKSLDYPAISVWTKETSGWKFLAFSPRGVEVFER